MWVPVKYSEFKRKDFSTAGLDEYIVDGAPVEDMFTEPTPGNLTGISEETAEEVVAMYSSVQTYGGFYIARYEAGTIEPSGFGIIRGDVVSKKGVNVYNYIAWNSDETMDIETGGAVEVSRSMYPGHSTLCYGVQWDAVMRWISNDENLAEYLINSTGKGNYETNSVITTGENPEYQMKNIYYMAGNVWEWTMETHNWKGAMEDHNINFRVYRGGGYVDSGRSDPVCGRFDSCLGNCNDDIGFRVAFYV